MQRAVLGETVLPDGHVGGFLILQEQIPVLR